MFTRTEFLASYLRARFGNTERGATAVEWVLLILLIIVVCFVAVKFLNLDGSKKVDSK